MTDHIDREQIKEDIAGKLGNWLMDKAKLAGDIALYSVNPNGKAHARLELRRVYNILAQDWKHYCERQRVGKPFPNAKEIFDPEYPNIHALVKFLNDQYQVEAHPKLLMDLLGVNDPDEKITQIHLPRDPVEEILDHEEKEAEENGTPDLTDPEEVADANLDIIAANANEVADVDGAGAEFIKGLKEMGDPSKIVNALDELPPEMRVVIRAMMKNDPEVSDFINDIYDQVNESCDLVDRTTMRLFERSMLGESAIVGILNGIAAEMINLGLANGRIPTAKEAKAAKEAEKKGKAATAAKAVAAAAATAGAASFKDELGDLKKDKKDGDKDEEAKPEGEEAKPEGEEAKPEGEKSANDDDKMTLIYGDRGYINPERLDRFAQTITDKMSIIDTMRRAAHRPDEDELKLAVHLCRGVSQSIEEMKPNNPDMPVGREDIVPDYAVLRAVLDEYDAVSMAKMLNVTSTMSVEQIDKLTDNQKAVILRVGKAITKMLFPQDGASIDTAH